MFEGRLAPEIHPESKAGRQRIEIHNNCDGSTKEKCAVDLRIAQNDCVSGRERYIEIHLNELELLSLMQHLQRALVLAAWEAIIKAKLGDRFVSKHDGTVYEIFQITTNSNGHVLNYLARDSSGWCVIIDMMNVRKFDYEVDYDEIEYWKRYCGECDSSPCCCAISEIESEKRNDE